MYDTDTASSSLISALATSAQLVTQRSSNHAGGGHPRSRAPTATPKHPVPVLAHASIQSMMMMMMSESPGSAPGPSCKHDSNTSQPKALTRVSRTRSLAPRHSPTGLLHGLCTMFSNTAKPTGVSVVTALQMQLASHFHKAILH